jgi:CDP-glucose 4,6-dehydratase
VEHWKAPLEGMVKSRSEVWKGRSVLITGNTGFKGAWLSLWLSRLGALVTGFALPPETEPNLFSLMKADNPTKTTFGDVRNLTDIQHCFEKTQPSVVFHMAAQSLVRPSYKDPVGTYATNVMGTVNILEAIRRTSSVEAAVIITSDKCYANREWHWAYREDEPMGGYDPYSSSKGCAELVTSAYRNSFFDNSKSRPHSLIASVRAGNVVGGGDWSFDRLIPDIVRALSKNLPIEIRSPAAIRPWQHVLDPLNGYILVAEHLLGRDGDAFAEAWNFGPSEDECRPVSYIADRLTRAWHADARWFKSNDEHPHEATFLKVDSSKAKARLGWKCKMPLDTTLDWTIEWYRRHSEGVPATLLTNEQIARFEELEG